VRVAFAADHGGAALKDELLGRLRTDPGGPPRTDELSDELIDLGGDGSDPTDDYPDFAVRIGRAIQGGAADRGVLVCGSGVGASVAACKMTGIRASVCHDTYSAHQGVEHDDMNVLCLGGRIVGIELALEIVRAYLGAEFTNEPRHRRRVDKVLAIEAAQGDPRPAVSRAGRQTTGGDDR
jgi:ribose 5-phosphate isomerase B